jgi:hypothetical protein
MTNMKFIKRLYHKLLRKNHYPLADSQKQYVFSSGGTDYYQFADFNNIPALRGMKTMVFYEEMKMKCSLEYLKMHTEAVDNILTAKDKIDIFDLKKLNDQLKQRLDIALETELVYKIASIVFFDSKEDVRDYDFSYNAKKIAHWKKHHADAFFLLKPVQELVPALKDMSGNLQQYSQVVRELNALHLENISPHLLPAKTTTLKGSSSSSVKAIRPN